MSTCAALWVGRDDVHRTVTTCHSDLWTDMPVGALEPLVNGCFGDTAGIIKALMGFLCMSCLTQLLGKSVIPRHLCRKKKKKEQENKTESDSGKPSRARNRKACGVWVGKPKANITAIFLLMFKSMCVLLGKFNPHVLRSFTLNPSSSVWEAPFNV